MLSRQSISNKRKRKIERNDSFEEARQVPILNDGTLATQGFETLSLDDTSKEYVPLEVIHRFNGLENFGYLQFPNDPNPYSIDNNDFIGISVISAKHRVRLYRHRQTNKEIVLKFIPIPLRNDQNFEKTIDHLYNEVKTHGLVTIHANVVDLYGFFFYQQFLVICMEKMNGSLLDLYNEFHQNVLRFPEQLAAAFGISILHALKALREHNITHRDIKPENILFNYSGEIKLADFGSARIDDESITSSFVGTALYKPPEIFGGTTSLGYCITNSSQDIWSLGITLIEILYGGIPYKISKQKNFNIIEITLLIKNTKTNELIDKASEKCQLSLDMENFIKCCIDLNPLDRINLDFLAEYDFYMKLAAKSHVEYVRKCIDYTQIIIEADSYIKKIEGENKLLKENEETKNTKILKQEQKIDELKQKKSTYKNSCVQLNQENEELRIWNNSLNCQLVDKDKIILKLMDDNKYLEQNLTYANEVAQQAKKDHELCKMEIERLKNEKSRYSQSISRERLNHDYLSNTFEDPTSQRGLKDFRQENSRLQSKIMELETKIREIQNSIPPKVQEWREKYEDLKLKENSLTSKNSHLISIDKSWEKKLTDVQNSYDRTIDSQNKELFKLRLYKEAAIEKEKKLASMTIKLTKEIEMLKNNQLKSTNEALKSQSKSGSYKASCERLSTSRPNTPRVYEPPLNPRLEPTQNPKIDRIPKIKTARSSGIMKTTTSCVPQKSTRTKIQPYLNSISNDTQSSLNDSGIHSSEAGSSTSIRSHPYVLRTAPSRPSNRPGLSTTIIHVGRKITSLN